MRILGLEFSSPQRSVAVARDGRVLAAASETGKRTTHAFGMIEQVLADARLERGQIEVLAVGLGPGSYTGIRVALAIAQGWQLAAGVKLLGSSSVEAIVAEAQAEKIFGRVAVMIDAQRGEFYLATYHLEPGGWKEIAPLKIVTLATVEAQEAGGEVTIHPDGALG